MARKFRGETTQKLDQKGRVSIPAPFRRVIEEGDPDWQPGTSPTLVLIYGLPGPTLEGLSVDGIERLERRIAKLPAFSRRRVALERMISTKSVYVQVDDTGRIVLPKPLRDKIGVRDQALFAGMGERFQIWEPEAYARDMAAVDDWVREAAPEGNPLAFLEDLGEED